MGGSRRELFWRWQALKRVPASTFQTIESSPLIISPTEADPAERPIRLMQTLVGRPDWLHGKMMHTRSRNEFPGKADNKQAVND
jgi:hypothetical protein